MEEAPALPLAFNLSEPLKSGSCSNVLWGVSFLFTDIASAVGVVEMPQVSPRTHPGLGKPTSLCNGSQQALDGLSGIQLPV